MNAQPECDVQQVTHDQTADEVTLGESECEVRHSKCEVDQSECTVHQSECAVHQSHCATDQSHCATDQSDCATDQGECAAQEVTHEGKPSEAAETGPFVTANCVLKYRAKKNGIIMNFVIMPITAYFALLVGSSLQFWQYYDFTQYMYVLGIIVVMGLWLLRQLSPDHRILIYDAGMVFSKHWSEDLVGRCERTWDDLHGVEFGGILTPKELAKLDYLIGCSLTLDFYSGGAVVLELDKMHRKEVAELFMEIERHCEQSVVSKRAFILERILLTTDPSDLEVAQAISMDALESQFSATHFVPLKTGSLLQNGRYEVVIQLASGGMSAIYLAHLRHNQDKNAVKETVVLKESVLPANTDNETRAKAKELFTREAQLLLRLDHPQITRVKDFFVEQDRDYIVLDYKAGASFRLIRADLSTETEQTVIKWAAQIAGILHYLHTLEPPVVHRDLTPDNLIRGNDGQVYVIDFGAANEFVSKATGTLVGKQAYIPPEQYRGKAEPKSDIYAFGATLYFLLTGKDPVPLSSSRPSVALATPVSQELDDLVAACTQLEPEDRPDSTELVQICNRLAREV